MNANGREAGRKATSVDVARLAGVSQSTVSRTLADGGSVVAPATREKVVTAARALGYTPNAIARSLITRQTNIVGIVATNLASPFQPYVVEKFLGALQRTGRQALVFTTPPDQEMDDILPLVLQYQVDGLIITSATLSSARLDAYAREDTPIILFNRSMPGEHITTVCCDNVQGARMAADRLVDAGHHRFACIVGNLNWSTARDRERGFMERLAERGAPPPLRIQAPYTYTAGYDAAATLLERDDPPDALFCGSDIAALGALDYARERGLRVPDDLSVIGFDDMPMASWAAYALTTIRQPVDEMIAATLDLLAERIANPATPAATCVFPVTHVERGSARPVRRSGEQ